MIQKMHKPGIFNTIVVLIKTNHRRIKSVGLYSHCANLLTKWESMGISNMAFSCVDISWKYSVIFKSFAFILIALDLAVGHSENLGQQQQQQHHNNHVCNHQHPKAHEVRPMNCLNVL